MRLRLVPDEMVLYTDGSCWPNPGPGGWAVIREDNDHGALHYDPVAGGHEGQTTNNQMEGTAIIEAMRFSDGNPLHIFSDSMYWINTLTAYAPTWRRRGWTKNGGPIKNLEMVKEALALYEQGNVRLTHIRGHQGNPGNEAADAYADLMRREQEELMEATA